MTSFLKKARQEEKIKKGESILTMGFIIAFIAATIFLIGLYQWAQGGANLWRIFRLKRNEKFLS